MEKCTKHEALIKATELCGGEIKASLSKTAILTKYYQNSIHAMQRSKKGKEYAVARGLDYDKLNMGYCGYEVGKTWNKNLQENAEKLGLFKIKNCIIFPTKNKDGQIVSIYGRSVTASNKSKHFYLKGGHKGLYPSYPKSEITKLILTESIIDAATIIQHTEWPALALYGTNGFTKEHEAAIKGLNDLEEVILFFDGDEAGHAAKEKYHKQLKELRQDIQVSYVNTPDGEDANSLIISHEPEILSHLIESRSYFSVEKQKEPNQKTATRGKLNTENPKLILYETDLLHITILGGIKITGLDRLRVTLKIEKKEYSHHLPVRHSLDLYHSKQVEQLANKMAESLEIGTAESERTISQLTGALENYRQNKLELLKPKKTEKKEMTEGERAEAIKYLKSKKLLRNTLQDIAKSGIVGETNNSLIAYLAYTSRKREKPLHIMCLGASGTRKTYLQEKVSELIPEEDKIEITSLSDNAFYYFGREELKHKLILIEDLDGAENVLYPLRELQSKRRISKTVTLKDNKGNLKTITLRVEGPVCVSGCTTRERIYEDNANRCILLYIDDSNEQDKRIMTYQQKGEETDRVVEEDWTITFGGMTFKAKVVDSYFVSSDQGDVEHGGANYIQALSKESLFGDADDKKNSSSFFTSLDETSISTTEKARNAVDGKVSDSESVLGFYWNADPKGDYDFKRSILAGDKESDANVNTSYVLRTGNKKWITNRNEAGNYLFGMAAKKVGSPLALLKLSGHAVEWKNGKMRMDERSEQIMLKAGWKSY